MRAGHQAVFNFDLKHSTCKTSSCFFNCVCQTPPVEKSNRNSIIRSLFLTKLKKSLNHNSVESILNLILIFTCFQSQGMASSEGGIVFKIRQTWPDSIYFLQKYSKYLKSGFYMFPSQRFSGSSIHLEAAIQGGFHSSCNWW